MFRFLLRPLAMVAVFAMACSPLLAVDFEWDGSVAGNNQWNGFDASTLDSNWSLNAFPDSDDTIRLTNASVAGPVTIDLNGPQSIQRVDANGVEGTYTFENTASGALTFVAGSTEAIITRDAGSFVFENDLLFEGDATRRINVQETGGKITIDGNVASAALSGTTVLMPTVVNTSLPVGVEIAGVISDGTAQVAISSGFDGNTLHPGTVRVTGNNTYTGSTRVNIGTLEFNSIANIGGGANALGQPESGDSTIRLGTDATGASSATLRYLGTGNTSNRVIELVGKSGDFARIDSSGTGALVLTGGINNTINTEALFLAGTNTNDNTIAGAIQGADTDLRKEGTGKWILSGDSPTFDGALVVAEGDLVLSGSIGTTTANAGVFQVNNAGEITLDGGYLAVSNINKSTNGTINFNAGTIRVTNAFGSVSSFSGPLVIGSSAGSGATLQLQGGSKTFDDVTLNGTDDTLEIGGSGTWTFDNLDNSAGGTIAASSGDLSINGGVFTHRVDSGTAQIQSQIFGTGGLTKQGAGTLELTESNPYTGDTRIEGGILRTLGNRDHISSLSDIFVAAGATLDLAAGDGESVGPLSGGGTVLTADGADIFIHTSGANATFAGSITGGGGLTKNNSGTQTLTGANNYTGATSLNTSGGSLEIAAGGSIAGTSGVTYSSATLAITGGTLDTPGNIRPISNSATFTISSGLVKANAIDRTVNSNYLNTLNWTGGTLHLLSATAITGSTITAIDRPFGPSLALDNDMALIVDNTFSVTSIGSLTLNGGSLTANEIVAGGNFTFNSGTVTLRSDQTLDSARLNALDLSSPLVANKSLAVEGVATLSAPLVVAGGTFSAGSIVNPENLILASGTLNVTSGDFDVAASQIVDVTSEMNVNVTGGGLNVAAGGEFNAINATLSFRDGVTNDGDINLINSSVSGSLITNVGGSANLLGSNTIDGNLRLSESSNLLIEIGGTGTGESDTVGVFGNSAAELDGSLIVSLSEGFTPTAGQQFTVLTAAVVIDNGLTLGGSAANQFELVFGTNSVILQAVAALAGDYNGNGVVDAADYTVWRDGLGTSFTQADYDIWKNNFGNTLSTATATAVPEPASLLLLMVMAMGLPVRFR